MASSPRFSLLVLLLAFAALLEPVRASSHVSSPSPSGQAARTAAAPSTQPAWDLEARLDRINLALRERFGPEPMPAHLDEAVARGFANGPRGGFANAAYRGFANGHPYYGGPSRAFVNGGGGYNGGGFVNARPRGGGFVNW